MSQRPPSVELEAPQPIQKILFSMNADELRSIFQHLRESYDLIYEKTADGIVIAPPSNSPASSTVRAVLICRDVAALLETNANA